MIIVSCIGKIVSEPIEEGKKRSCRLAVKLDKNQIIKLVTWSKQAPLELDSMVFVVGKLSKIEDVHLQLEATLICPTNELSPMAMVGTGGAKFLEQRYDQNARSYYSYQIGSFENTTKSYTNVSVTSSHPLCQYVNDKRVAVAGIVNTNTYTSNKTGKEVHVMNLRGRDVEITERKDNNGNGGHVVQSQAGQVGIVTNTVNDFGEKGNIPF